MTVPKHDPLIETAVRTMPGEEELRQSGAGYLKILRSVGKGGEEEIIERWESVDRAKSRVSGKGVLVVILVVLTGWAAVFDYPEIYEIVTDVDLVSTIVNRVEVAEKRLSAKLDPAQKQLLYGDISKKDQIGRKEALYRSDPDNPAYLAEYALACFAGEKPLPPDFLETARRIDPNNAWFTYLAAAAEAKNFGRMKERRSHSSGGKRTFLEPISWDINDRARLDRALAILRAGRNQTRYQTYFSEMLSKRLAILPQETRQERFDSIGYLSSSNFAGGSTRFIANAIAARAWLAGVEKNEEDLREASQDAERLIEKSLGIESGLLIEVIVNRHYIFLMTGNFGPACDRLNLTDEKERWRQIENRLSAWDDARKDNMLVVDGVALPDGLRTGAVERGEASSTSEEWIVKQPFLTDADIAPWRFLEHEYISHFSCYVAWAALAVICGMLSLYRYFTPKVILGLARRMKMQLTPVDWSWMLGLGVLLPFVLVVFVNRFTPLGGRDYGVAGSLAMLPASQFVALVVLWLIVPVWLVHWRLGKRLRIFGFGNWNAWAIGIAIACAVAFLSVIKWAAITGTVPRLWVYKLGFPDIGIEGRPTSEEPLWIAAGILAVPVLWIFYGVGAALLSATRRTLYRATAARVLIPIYASAMVLCLAATPFLKMAENYWFQRDEMNRFDPAMPSWSRYEYRTAVQMRKELREVMGYDNSPRQTAE